MAEFLTTYAVSTAIENIIMEAKKEVVLVSPFLQLSRNNILRLKDASSEGVSIKIVYGKNELRDDEMSTLKELEGLELSFCENLHAKCYYNEVKMVITSMNLYDYSERNNREMGVLITKMRDSKLYRDAVKETESILRSAEMVFTNRHAIPIKAEKKNNKQTGYCIRCSTEIPYNPNEPYCDKCFNIWNGFGNRDYEENKCHCCNKPHDTSMNYPQCYPCWQSYDAKTNNARGARSSNRL